MEEFLSTFDNQEFGIPMMVFISIFILAIALFHSFLLQGLYEVKLKPKWILYVAYPCLFLLVCSIRMGYGIILFVCLFGVTFVLAIVGMIGSGIKGIVKRSKYNSKTAEKNPIAKRIVMVIASIAFVALFFIGGPFSIFFIFVLILLNKILSPDQKDRFLKLQATLPTSKVRSVAMGLAEIEGRLIMIESMEAPMKKKQCIGYLYVTEERSVDDDGKESYHTVKTRTECRRFYIEDETGRIEINPEKLTLTWLKLDEQYCSHGMRYSQYLLLPDSQMLLIGKASEENGKPVMVYEDIYDVFVIAPSNSVSKWNKYKPLRQKLAVTVCFVAFLIALILIVPIKVEDGIVYIKLGRELLSWDYLFD